MNSDLEELRGYTVGCSLALLNLMRAVIQTHPNPQALLPAMERCRQEALVVLTTSPHNMDKTLESFHEMWDAALLGRSDPSIGS